MAAVLWLSRHGLRARWRSVVVVALLVGVAGGLVLATAAGARRTASAYDRFVDETATRDANVQIDDGDVAASLAEIARLDLVAASGELEIIPAQPTDESLQTGVDLAIFTSPDGRWAAEVDRPLVLEGRPPAPTAVDEVLINELTARQTGLDVGDRIEVATFTPEQLDALHSGGTFSGFGGPVLDLRVVGIGRQASDLQGADISSGGVLLTSPAVSEALDGRAGALGGLMGVRLAPGATFAELRSEVRRIVGPGASFDVRSADEEFGNSTREAATVLARALATFAAVAAVAGAVMVGGSIARQVAASQHALRTLGALGCDRRERSLVGAAPPAAGVAVGALLAVGAAVAASARFPISVARQIEPDPGPAVDVAALGTGAAVLLVVGVGWSILSVRRLDRVAPRAARRVRMSPVLPPAVSIGVGHAFLRHSQDRTVPVRAALGAAVLAVAGLVGTATVTQSFDRLVDDPVRYGWAWSAEPDIYTDDPDALVDEIASTPGVEAVGSRHSARVELDGVVVSAAAFEAHHGVVEPPLRDGRLPAAPDEVAIGARTADQLDASIGDRVPAATAGGEGPVDVEVVGIVVSAPVETADPASGAVLTLDGLDRIRRSDGYTSVLVRYRSGFDASAMEASLQERELADFSVVYARPRRPGTLENLDRAMPVVTSLGAFFAALGVVGVGHAVVVGSRRRRRELATLRALGMHRRQVRSIVVVSALATTAFGVVVGIPLGSVAGRSAWRLVIGGHGLLDAPSTPVLALVAVAPAALLTALLVSWWPGATSTRRAADALRTE